jgi:hypothetical protein
MTSVGKQLKDYELSDLDKVVWPTMVKAFLLYELSSTANLDQLIASLQEGLKNAVLHVPLMKGRVENDDSGKPHIKIAPEASSELSVRYFSSTEHKSYESLVDSSFSADDLDHLNLLPELPAQSMRVCVAQLNVIPGGLILGFAMHHTAGDWASTDALLSLICRGAKAHMHGLPMPVYIPDLNRDPFNGEETTASTSQKDLLDKCPGYFVVDMKAFSGANQLPTPPAVQAKIYQATESSVQDIKQRCTPLEGVDYITSYDCIAALLWTSITRARLHRHPEKLSLQSIAANPINLRARDPENATSQDYFGNAVYPSWVGPIDVQSLLSDNGVSTAASLIRKSINSTTVASAKHLATLARSLLPSERLSFPMNFHNMDILMNSWYSGKAENYDIGTGSPYAFRTHRANTGACCLILPNFSHSSTRVYEIFIQLPAEEHDLLREDPGFSSCFKVLA